MRVLAILALLAAASSAPASAQSPAVGGWDVTLSAPNSTEVFDRGRLVIPETGAQGTFSLVGQGFTADLVNTTLTADGNAFTLAATLSIAGQAIPLTFTGTATADRINGTVQLAGQPELPFTGTRVDPNAPVVAPVAQAAVETDNAAVFAPLALPAPSETRTADGRPGPGYWQNRTDYRIRAALDSTTNTVAGTVTLRYTNNSPDALPFLWMQLEQNLFADGSRGGEINSNPRFAGTPDAGQGFRLGAVSVGGRTVTPVVTDTRMRVDLPEPVAGRGGTVEVTIPYSFVVPEDGSDRMGRLATPRGTVYSIAQWYPRAAVYDDVNGWNTLPYLGQGEFYLDYGDYDVEVTVPASMQVVSTGTLQNEDDVYTRAQRERLDRARTSTSRVYLVEPAEVGTATASPSRTGTATWHFTAENVRDVAWAASAAFIVDAAAAPVRQEDGTTNNVLIQSAYPPSAVGTPDNPGWEEATRFARASILNNSRWFPYPYPVAISVASNVGGMEYPMLHFSSAGSRNTDLFEVIDHELGHNWFPMIVGSDERRFAWMDEGVNTFINPFSVTTFYNGPATPAGVTAPEGFTGTGTAERTQAVAFVQPDTYVQIYRQLGAADETLMTAPDQLSGQGLGLDAYIKPGAGLTVLRDAVLGPERFDEAFEAYIRRWAYKHPQPSDFFRTMEDVSGEDLDWFWRGWFMTTDTFDQGLTALTADAASASATVFNYGGLVMPSTVEFTFSDGTTARAAVAVESYTTTDTATARVPLNGRTVTAARLDPDHLLPDTDRSNDAATL
ncbi:MAG TPA: M1 family metallopeptidase [Rubricoccaceae bacterium]